MENKNVFDEILATLITDAKNLQCKLAKFQENNNFSEALSCMRLLKDTLALIKEYDWVLKYSEYETDGHKEISIWEQNHCGEIRNLKRHHIADSKHQKNVWIDKFESCIAERQSCICTYGDQCRGSGKSYALASLCHKHSGVVVYSSSSGIKGIENADKRLGVVNTFLPYSRGINLRQYENKIIFIDEGSGLSDQDIEVLKKKHIIIGFI